MFNQCVSVPAVTQWQFTHKDLGVCRLTCPTSAYSYGLWMGIYIMGVSRKFPQYSKEHFQLVHTQVRSMYSSPLGRAFQGMIQSVSPVGYIQ